VSVNLDELEDEQYERCKRCRYQGPPTEWDDGEIVWVECRSCGSTFGVREPDHESWPPNAGEFWVVTGNGMPVAGPFATGEDGQRWLDLYALRDLLPGTCVSEVIDTREHAA
jgi:hypothetical protein